ncbi:hypothetical protein B7Y94_03180 [Candidatus Saccharibacteria bacterium 32-49-12]|nr:MAG: hypothetical protein B7Y94_03180 [Candidatus Saccharibacteria bacterium 32-49-12]
MQLDETFLDEVGLSGLPDDQKQAFLQHTYEQLNVQVGNKLSEGLSNEQMVEFESIIDRREDAIERWLNNNAPDFSSDPLFQRISRALSDNPGSVQRAEYAATKWLEINRPDYRNVVVSVLDELKKEIVQNRDTILGQAN